LSAAFLYCTTPTRVGYESAEAAAGYAGFEAAADSPDASSFTGSQWPPSAMYYDAFNPLSPYVPVDASPPLDAADPPDASCGDDADDCAFPPSACADSHWLVYYVNGACALGHCQWQKRYFYCDQSCSVGGCRTPSTF
jgi:hypothetical protein